ncbi:YcbK family protein [Aureimonas phyllosphaerae]|uniref:Murein endopeptidase K n=1 Tax=Aureimonas phyllosphaerae TaxID=1166078 RepID=A0A7W6BNP0_9HYPH|nr:D-Ala-D-Ala carboxypeptidase family metallohydrolase [Aureimonas phyllosphaerae]MBB3935288.1 uncharacterized protein YcbK (DUF882 family) [Aureimonas phyllosphaerae]MBB3959296.1 uncharacterized protein YcbK (DUF882 family) [Aureimonas phyllosphaerae]
MDDRLTERFFSARGLLPRKALLAATILSLSPLLGGCVSAVDESSAFGFSQAPEPKSVEDAIAQAAKEGEPGGKGKEPAKVAEANDSTPAASPAPLDPTLTARVAEAGASEKTEAVVAAVAGNSDTAGGIQPGRLLTRTTGPAIAAFAAPKKSAEADRSLYASLYNQSQAKTPLRNAEAGKPGRVIVHQRNDAETDIGANSLPGVDPKSLFEIGQRASVDSELMDDIGSSYQLASLSGIARLAPSGLLIQREDVVTNCFDSNLMSLISQIERRFKQKVVITSGFRSPQHNRRVNGAKASMHMACKAADLHVPGVNGQDVAQFVRALPGRGGVGTYCHTAAIHIDVGKMRDWNWPCRRRQST